MVHGSEDEDEADAHAVISIFFDRKLGGNEHNRFIEQLKMKDLHDDVIAYSPYIQINRLVQELNIQKMYYYKGGLTTPPCTEIAQFFIINDPQPISDEQLEEFTKMWAKNPKFANGNGNNRGVQKLNGRTIYYKGELEKYDE